MRRSALAVGVLVLAGFLATGTSKKPAEPRFPSEEPAAGRPPAERPVDPATLPVYPACPAPPGVITRQDLDRILDRKIPAFLSRIDVEKVARQDLASAAHAPAETGSGFGGWRLRRFHPGDPCLGRAGLRPGDVVVSVNGSALSRPETLFAAWTALRTATTLSVRIERAGEPLLFVVQIR
jgi:hypothetical protein